ncbi:MAG: universal stress protein [Polyangiaceae bacterium]|nr:universal stress protein [Polyangiaceae bacterium]
MTEPSISRIIHLVAVDTSALADRVLDQAVALTSKTAGAQLHVVHVVDTIPIAAATVGGSPFGIPSATVMLKAGREHLERLQYRAEQQGVPATGHLIVGNPRTVILQLSSDLGADLLIIGTHDPGKLERLLLGSIAEILVRKAPCPVLVVRPKRQQHPEVPEILPPCPDCVVVQRASNGEKLWCERHVERHPRAHRYYEYPEGFGIGSSTFRQE